ncbi:hypothetical protein [Salinisphaera sp. Q1T1-3]|uniref:hypothetical protein n=1 Tax=Salinisphaera sp. Q1T1-3 TaxID=2321229 RepID=UPI0011C479B9|nr:hypothetical protein [Salinisphaera sp. Q1T1-3]
MSQYTRLAEPYASNAKKLVDAADLTPKVLQLSGLTQKEAACCAPRPAPNGRANQERGLAAFSLGKRPRVTQRPFFHMRPPR